MDINGVGYTKIIIILIEKLKEFGYNPKEICERGISATIQGNQTGKTFLFRADMGGHL